MSPDELLRQLTSDWISSADTALLEQIYREIGAFPKNAFPAYDRLHECAVIIQREIASRQSAHADTTIERRHQELLQHSEDQLRTSVALHEKAMAQARRFSWFAASVAAISAAAAVVSAFYACPRPKATAALPTPKTISSAPTASPTAVEFLSPTPEPSIKEP
jgi:hypothetical protein